MNLPLRIALLFRPQKTSLCYILFLQLAACTLWGQPPQKKILTPEDYSKWGRLELDKINADGKWISYYMTYENGLDTLFVKNTGSTNAYSFPLGNRGGFISSGWFACHSAAGLHILNIKTGKQEIVSGALQYDYATVSRQLLILLREKDNSTTLLLQQADGSLRHYIAGVSAFSMDPTHHRVLYTTAGKENTICLLDLRENKTTILSQGDYTFSNMTWHSKGKALSFIRTSADGTATTAALFCYSPESKKLYISPELSQASFAGDSLTISTNSYPMRISEDMEKIFFTVKRKPKPNELPDDSAVQLWSGNDKLIYPMKEKEKSFKGLYLALWQPKKDVYHLISNDSLSQFMLTGDQNHAILSYADQYEPQYNRSSPRDFYVVDLSTGKKELLLKKHSSHFLTTIASPKGNYIAYFSEKNWWVYDVKKKTHTNITQNTRQSFFHNQPGHPNNEEPYPNLGWTLEDREILLCDAYDIWAIVPDGSSARRLTHGRETQTQFRLAGYSRRMLGKSNYNGWIYDAVDLDKGLLLEVSTQKGEAGYYTWTKKSNHKLVFSENTRLDQLSFSNDGHFFIYREQSYDLSPRLILKDKRDKTTKILVQSNPQQHHYYWGKATLIDYMNAKGKPLQGILYYPAGYSDQKKYPMIVYIYERMTHNLHNLYLYPSETIGEDTSFSIASFTSQGYFVLAPDISYEIGNPGFSALDCVVSATNEIIKKGLVQPSKIGLIGHSFGGYETDFIITQTPLFAAAIAGSAVTDLTSNYLAISKAMGRPDIWRFESQQFRMGQSLFDNREGYLSNSPITHVHNCVTPLLSWTGDDDDTVSWNQSLAFYSALRRLEKPHIMLVYPKEGHTLQNAKNQKDLSNRMHQWFDYYLKDLPAPEWLINGVSF